MSPDNNEIKCIAFHKEMKLPFHWTSTVPKRYKKNVFIGALHCFNSLLISLISLNFEEKV